MIIRSFLITVSTFLLLVCSGCGSSDSETTNQNNVSPPKQIRLTYPKQKNVSNTESGSDKIAIYNSVIDELSSKPSRSTDEARQIRIAVKLKGEEMKLLAKETKEGGQIKAVTDRYTEYSKALDACKLNPLCINAIEEAQRKDPLVIDPDALAEGFKSRKR